MQFFRLFFVLILAFPLEAICQYEGVFFKLTHPETKEVSYLYGTISHLPEGWYKIPPEVQKALEESRKFISDREAKVSSKSAKDLEKALFYEGGRSVTSDMDKESKQSFELYIKENFTYLGAGASQIYKARPGFTVEQLFPYHFSAGSSSVALELETKAKALNKSIVFLEVDEKRHIKAQEHYGNRQEAATLAWVMGEEMGYRAQLVYHYLRGDYVSLDATHSERPDLFAKERSNFWTHQLVEELKRPSFLAVDFQQLMGKESLQFLLKLVGFDVQPIAISGQAPPELKKYLNLD